MYLSPDSLDRRTDLQRKLEHLIAQELAANGTAEKLHSYGMDINLPAVKTIAPEEAVLNHKQLVEIAKKNAQTSSRITEELLLLGIAWELLYRGEGKPPSALQQLREEVIARAAYGESQDQLENLWVRLTLVDTDMF